MKYMTQRVTAIEPIGGYRVKVTFADGFSGDIDLAPLLSCGPIFKPLRNLDFFRRVTITSDGVPEWLDDLDLSPDSLRVWCEAGRFMDYEETDAWVEQHSESPEKVA